MSLRDAGQASLAFFYFDFRDEGKKHLRDLVTCLLVQLSSYSSPCREVLFRIYSKHGDGMRKPRTRVLRSILREMLSVAPQQPIYIIVDALDECPNISGMPTPREGVLSLLEELVRLRLENLRVCVTSRLDIDIRTVLEPLASGIVSLHDESGKIEVISHYVRILLDRGADPNGDKVKVIDIDQKLEGVHEWVQHDDINVETIDDKVRRRSVNSKEQGPPSLASRPIPPSTAPCGRLGPFGVRELSLVRAAARNATQPIISIKRAAPQSTTGATARLPAASLGGAAAPATSAPAQFSFATLTPSRAPTFPARTGDQKSDGDGAIAPSSAWWNNLRRKRTNPIEQAEGYARTRSVRPFLSTSPTDTHPL
jgi:hypothetical protein